MNSDEFDLLKAKVGNLSQDLEDLSYSFFKKTGSGSKMNATAGGWGGFEIHDDHIRDLANSMGMSANISASDDVRFWAGATFANRTTAPYRVYESGALVATSATISGSVSVGSLDIPDTITANSMHVETDGDTFWGATTFAAAPASISKAGAAIFKSITVGGTSLQYAVGNAGLNSFGDGSDGTATMDGASTPTGTTKSGSDYTMTRDVYWTTATMSTGTTLNPAGYRIFCNTELILNGTAVIRRNGVAGGNGGVGTGGTAGTALADGYLKGSVAGQAGGAGRLTTSGVGTAGTAGTNTTNSIGNNGVAGGAGGSAGGGSQAGGGAGAGSTATAANVKLIANWHLATLLDVGTTGATVKFDNSSGAGSGGGGAYNGADGGAGGGGGGGSGSAGGIVAIYSKTITVGASASITANGGNGGAGGNANGTPDAGGGGGGGAGNGGQVILVYNSLSNSGSITATAGTKGSGGSKIGDALAGSAGTDGVAGTVRQFALSL